MPLWFINISLTFDHLNNEDFIMIQDYHLNL